MAAELGIKDLGDVISTLEKYEFADHRWIELGFMLHISEPKLETVRADNPLNAKACLRACLAHWLRWNYDVDKYGKPSMEKLAAAVKDMGLKHVASQILGETNGTTQGASAGSGGGGVAVTVTAETVDDVKKELNNVLRENQVRIHGIFTETDETLKEIARELNAVNIIGKPVQRNPTYEAMIGSFFNGIKLKEDIEEIEEHSKKFFKALSNVQGPVADAGKMIKKKWKKAVKDKCGFELRFPGGDATNEDFIDLLKSGTLKKWFDDKEEGYIDLTLTRIHMVGPAGSGKTCTQNLLLNEPIPEHIESNARTTSSDPINPLTSSDTSSSDPTILEHPSSNPRISESSDTSQSSLSSDPSYPTTDIHYNTATSSPNSSSSNSITDSTPLACKAVKALKISSDDDETWEGITRKKLLERLAFRLKRAADKFYQQKQATHTSASLSSTESTSGTHTRISDEEVLIDLEVTSKTPDKPHDYRPLVKEMVDLLPVAKAQLSEKWAYIVDSGGQPAFQELLPVFTRAATLNIITLDLSKGLDDEFEYTYRINGEKFPCDEKMKYSNRKIFNSVVSACSAASAQKPLDIPYQTKTSEETTPKYSMSFVLGTHYDVVIKNSKDEKEAKEEVKQMSHSLMEQLDSHSTRYVSQKVDGDSIIYPVNTLVKDPNERKEISQIIFKKITGCIEAKLTVTLPIRLFIFELCLEERAENNGGFVTREEAEEEGVRLHMKTSEVEAALTYLHICTIILYYPDINPQLVFVDPQKIFDVLSQLLALTYVNKDTAQSFVPEIIQEEMTTLKKRGFFKECLLAKFTVNAVFTGKFQPKYFIELLKKCHVIAELQKKSSQTRDAELKYFLPSALRSYDNSFEKSLSDRKPLRFVWRKQEENNEEKVFVNVPQGIFSLMIVHLLNEEECVVRLSNPICSDEVTQFRDAVLLLVSFDKNDDDPDEHLYIINREKHIEVIFNGEKEQCPKINTLLCKVISKSANDINISVKDLNIAFACQRDDSEYCIVKNEAARKTSCRSRSAHTCTLDDSYWCWLNTTGTAQKHISGTEGSGIGVVEEAKIRQRQNVDPPKSQKQKQEEKAPHQKNLMSLDITDLQKVLNLLRETHFNGDWEGLGLELGLYQHPTLSNLQHTHDRGAALRECLTVWLQRADGVDKNGGANYVSLANAVERLGQRAAAGDIRRQCGIETAQEDAPVIVQQRATATSPKPQEQEQREKAPPPKVKKSTCSSCNWKVVGVVCIVVLAVLVVFGLVVKVYGNAVNEGVGQDHVNEGIINNDKNNDGKLTEEYHKVSDITLNVTNLQEILDVLGEGFFPDHRWLDLGLSLNLIHNDLSVIEADRPTAHRRLQEMLSLWLRRGRATWNGLAEALDNIKEYKAAEVVKAKVTNGKYEL